MTDKPKSALDEIFPKEIMERAAWFGGYDSSQDDYSEPGETTYSAVAGYLDYWEEYMGFSYVLLEQDVSFQIIAYDIEDKELVRRHIRLSLNIELIDDQSAQGEG